MPVRAGGHIRNVFPARLITRLLLVLALPSLAPVRADTPERFPFVIPADDRARTPVDVSALNPAPLTERSRIVARNGHFYTLSGRRVRFVGTNFAAGACFPRKEDAPILAARLRKYGFNCVRLHHMDAPWADPNIFYFHGGSSGKTTRALSPESLDRLDYLVYQFRRHGIYVDMNLHVTRAWSAPDGFPDADKIDPQGKFVSYFDARAVQLQREYARQLLTHRNAYTKTRYVDEPTVALIEITNEDSLLGVADTLADLPEHYRGQLAAGWNRFLRARHGSTARLLAAWNAGVKPLGETLIRNGRFAAGAEGWTAERHENAGMEMGVEDVADAPGGRALRLSRLHTDATDWHLQLHQTGLDLKEGETYTVSFAARAGAPRAISVGVRQDQSPWGFVGLDRKVALTTAWQRFTFSFAAANVLPGHSRLSFVLGGAAPDVFLADVSLRPGGGGVEIAPGQSLEAANLDIPAGITPTAPGRDYAAFLIDVEGRFARGMRDYIQNTLGAKAPVTCSQASYGGIGGVWRESEMDWVDMHAYWQHPNFPNRPWDVNDYRIGNTSMLRDAGAGTLDGLAMHRVAGKPFTVSEYDHPAPNEYAAEIVPIIFAFAAWQDWDGVFLFAYHGDDENWRRNRIEGFFDQAAHPGKLAFLPWAAHVFLRGALSPSPFAMTLTVPKNQIPVLKARGTDYAFWSVPAPVRRRLLEGPATARDFLDYRSAVRFVDEPGEVRVDKPLKVLSDLVMDWFSWDHDTDQLIVTSTEAQAVIGFVGGKRTELRGVSSLTVTVEPTPRSFAALTLAAMDGKRMDESASLLLTAVDKVENPGLVWNADRTFAANAWANGPTMAEAVTATITLETKAKTIVVYALDGTGKRKATVPSRLANGTLSFGIGPQYKTLWYEIAAQTAARR